MIRSPSQSDRSNLNIAESSSSPTQVAKHFSHGCSCRTCRGGSLWCPALQYLAAAGVGHHMAFSYIPEHPPYACCIVYGIIDYDSVEISSLQRQILHNEQTVGMLKTESAAKAIQRYAHSAYRSPTFHILHVGSS